MKPPEQVVADLPGFIEQVGLIPPSLYWMYRGQSDSSWPLIPKAGRPEYFVRATGVWSERGQTSSDLGRFNVWRKQAIGFCQQLPANDFECLAFAQHYGLATRLLDWTSNALVALFFAVEGKPEVDGAVYCFLADRIVNPDVLTPETCPDVVRYDPRPFDRRVLAQGGLFTYHPDPRAPLQAGRIADAKVAKMYCANLIQLTIAGAKKAGMQRHLRNLGVSRKALFPDLDGLSEDVNWQTRENAAINARKELA